METQSRCTDNPGQMKSSVLRARGKCPRSTSGVVASSSLCSWFKVFLTCFLSWFTLSEGIWQPLLLFFLCSPSICPGNNGRQCIQQSFLNSKLAKSCWRGRKIRDPASKRQGDPSEEHIRASRHQAAQIWRPNTRKEIQDTDPICQWRALQQGSPDWGPDR